MRLLLAATFSLISVSAFAHAPIIANAFVCGDYSKNGDLAIKYIHYLGTNLDVDLKQPGLMGSATVGVGVDGDGSPTTFTPGESYCIGGTFSYAQADDEPRLQTINQVVILK